MRRSKQLVLVGATIALVFAAARCRHSGAKSTPQTIGMPTAEGLPVTFSSTLPAQMAAEAYKNIPLLAAVADPANGPRRTLPFSFKCESFGLRENHCRMSYEGPELRMDLKYFLFGTMAGKVILSKGCTDANCGDKAFRLWWRTAERRSADGAPIYDLEICDIRGLEAKIGTSDGKDWSGPFDYLGQLLNSVGYLPDVHGFRVSVVEYDEQIPAYDENGRPRLGDDGKQLTETIKQYKPIAAYAGVGPLGGFPNRRCLLAGEPNDKRFRDTAEMDRSEGNIKSLPKAISQKMPTGQVKLAHDVFSQLVKQSSGKPITTNIQCRDRNPRSICQINVQGPELMIPVPQYLTGAVDAEIKILRQCNNPGCRQVDEAVINLATYPQGGQQVLEVCSMTGVEMAPSPKYFPGFGSTLGVPDVLGALMVMTPGSSTGAPSEATETQLTKVLLSVGGIGKYPTHDCDLPQN